MTGTIDEKSGLDGRRSGVQCAHFFSIVACSLQVICAAVFRGCLPPVAPCDWMNFGRVFARVRRKPKESPRGNIVSCARVSDDHIVALRMG